MDQQWSTVAAGGVGAIPGNEKHGLAKYFGHSNAESRWRAAEAQLIAIRQESQQLTALPSGPPAGASETAVAEAKKEVTLAEGQSQDRRRKRQEVADELAHAQTAVGKAWTTRPLNI